RLLAAVSTPRWCSALTSHASSDLVNILMHCFALPHGVLIDHRPEACLRSVTAQTQGWLLRRAARETLQGIEVRRDDPLISSRWDFAIRSFPRDRRSTETLSAQSGSEPGSRNCSASGG